MAAANEVCGDLCASGLVVASADVSGVGICGDETVDREGEVRRAVAAVAVVVVAEVAGRLAAFVAPGAAAEPGERLGQEAGGAGHGRAGNSVDGGALWLDGRPGKEGVGEFVTGDCRPRAGERGGEPPGSAADRKGCPDGALRQAD